MVTWSKILAMKNVLDRYGLIVVGLLVFGLDRWTKFYILNNGWEYVMNEGGVWGLHQGLDWLWVSLVVIVGLVVYVMRQKMSLKYQIGYGMVIGGGLGNLYDRLTLGAVIDWIGLVDWFAWFNIADMAINVGLGLIIFWTFYGKR